MKQTLRNRQREFAWNGSAAICKLYCDTTLQLILDAASDIYETNKE
jgi:hypothetical protein